MTAADTQSLAASRLPLRDRAVIWGGIVAISALAWVYLVRMPMAGGGAGSAGALGMMMPMAHRWTAADVWLTFWMWAVMMVAMMLPTASPMLLMYARVARGRRDDGGSAAARVWCFAAGYIAVWTAFSAGATAAQYALARTGIIDGALRTTPVAGAIILIVAGIYQLTPLKNACLKNCRSPIGFFMTEWREGARGALGMGLRHGASCVGCCWMLMALLFVAGAMNLAWVAAITAFVLLEKVAPFGRAIAAITGVALLVSGVALVVAI